MRVPKDWGKKDLVWTLTSHGKTEKAYGSLMPVWEIDAGTYQQNRGGPGELGEEDDPPSIKVEGAPQRTVAAGAALTLDAFVTDDGRPTARPSQSGSNARVEGPLMQAMVRLDRGVRLGVIWVVYRGDAKAVTFEPRKIRGRRRQGLDDGALQRARHLRPARLRRRRDPGRGEGRYRHRFRRPLAGLRPSPIL